MISDVEEEPEGPTEVRDDTGLVVGSPAWLELQRSRERSRTSSGITREGMWRIAAGAIVLVISLVTTLTIVTSSGAARIELEPSGYVAFCVAPLLLGVLLIANGLRQRGRSSRELLATLPPRSPSSPTTGPPPGDPT